MKRLLVILLPVLALASCKKNDDGGKATIVAYPRHHEKSINGATVYVKFGADDMPSDILTHYDMKVTASSNEDHVSIDGLRYGHYYLYSTGYDSTIMQNVKGGIGVIIKWKERKDDITVTVPVTED